MPFNAFDKKEIVSCVLCMDTPCSKACDRIDPASVIRSIRFENEKTAAAKLGGNISLYRL